MNEIVWWEVERSRTLLGGDDRWFANLTDPSGVSFGIWTAQPHDVPSSPR